MLKNGIEKSIFIWAVVCLVGFSVFHFWAPQDFFGMIHYVWIVLTVIGVGAMYYLIPNAMKNDVVNAWAVVSVVGMIVSIAMWQGFLDLSALGINYGILWAFLCAIGFLYTALFWKLSKGVYYAATVGCLVLTALMFFKVPPVGGFNWAFVPLGLVTSIPMFYDSLK